MDIIQIRDTAVRAARKAGEIQLMYLHSNLSVEETHKHDLKLEVDRLCDNVIFNAVRKRFPDHGILAEESGLSSKQGPFLWIIDPLDSSVNYWNILACVPEAGIVRVGGRKINYKEKEHLREMRKRIGVIYQLFNLVERRSVIANVLSGALGIFELLLEINREKRITLIIVLHHMEFVKNNFNRVVAIKEGAICFDGKFEALSQDDLNYIYGFDQEVR